MRVVVLAIVAALVLGSGPAAAQGGDRLLVQRPTLSRTHIVFVYGGDLWSVPREGGAASRLTAGPGVETSPAFSPDGSRIAFTGEYDGNVDVFVMPGRRRRAEAADVAPGGRHGAGLDARRHARALRVHAHRVLALLGVVHRGRRRRAAREAAAAHGGRGRLLARRRAHRVRAAPAGVHHLEALPRRQDDADLAGDRSPTRGSRRFRATTPTTSTPCGSATRSTSSRTATAGRRSTPTTPATKKTTRLFDNDGLDLKSASAGPGAIVYEQFGSLGLYDLKSGRRTPVPVTVAGDFPEVRERLRARRDRR